MGWNVKRSEMISQIHAIMDGTPIEYEYANQFLTIIEKLGMIPPSCEFKMGDMIVRDNCWEPEDDKFLDK